MAQREPLDPPRPSEIATDITVQTPTDNPHGNDPRGTARPHLITGIADMYIRNNPSWEGASGE